MYSSPHLFLFCVYTAALLLMVLTGLRKHALERKARSVERCPSCGLDTAHCRCLR